MLMLVLAKNFQSSFESYNGCMDFRILFLMCSAFLSIQMNLEADVKILMSASYGTLHVVLIRTNFFYAYISKYIFT